MPSNLTNVNAALAAYRAATDLNRVELEYQLIKSLEHYANRIVAIELHNGRPEIVNQAVQVALDQILDFKNESKFSTYFYTIVKRLCCGELRRKINNKETSFSQLDPIRVERLASYELDGDDRITLERLCKTLSKDEAALIEMKLQGFTVPEIAELTGNTEPTIASRWRRLRDRLRQEKIEQERSHLRKRSNDRRIPN